MSRANARLRPNAPHRPDAGFTLLEMLVALTLIGLLFAALAGGVRFAGRLHDRGEVVMTRAAAFQVTADFFTRQVERAFPLVVGERLNARFLVTAEPGRFSFPFLGRPGREGGRVRLAVFTVETVPGGQRLTYAEHRFRPGSGAGVEDAPERAVVLIEGPWRIAFSYLGPAAGTSWSERWTLPSQLPRVVRLSARIADGGLNAARAWPDVVARLRVDGDRGCLRPTGQLCRDAEMAR